ncbi:hypothetical protein KD050_12445 [Psychrobacillus sp. INOP01]|uniref:hypothetical protein n=1 Tax=Psychrobacillus sp. INOP01 TaxID=2829187 RepID=UPI001BA82E29|nr:hypothetical protein [Psychrobacillus sp. INOP01]QUG40123.1 hypothetical protein KD050_12445 [Psychrobacillus sp. INOP01]
MKMKSALVLGTVLLAFLLPNQSFANENYVPIETLKPAVHLEKPELKQTGGKLILSDSPETYSDNGAFYRDTATGEFRVFWHHQNVSGENRNVSLALTNTSDEPVMLYSKGVGASVSIYPDVAGKEALVQFLEEKAKKKYIKTLQPGESYYLETNADDGETVSGIAQYVVYTKHSHQQATVTATTLNYVERPTDPLSVEILPPDSHVRGSFPHFDREGILTYDTALGNAYVRLSSAASGQWSDKLPGEYEEGISVVDGNKPVINNGNYGVLYNLDVKVENSLQSPQQLSIYDNPAGGFGHFAMQWNGKLKTTGFLSYVNAWKFASEKIGANGNQYDFVTSLPGGASGPSVIYFVPEN